MLRPGLLSVPLDGLIFVGAEMEHVQDSEGSLMEGLVILCCARCVLVAALMLHQPGQVAGAGRQAGELGPAQGESSIW